MIEAVPVGFPKRMFKFLNHEHVDGMLTRGMIRNGTAREYREPDGKTGARSDAKEVVTNWQPGEGLQILREDHPFTRSLFPDGRPDGKPMKNNRR
jgi:hypothetical protein